MTPSIGSRHFVYTGEKLIKISQQARSDFNLNGKPALKQFAGQVIDIADVYVSLSNKRPDQILRIDGVRHKVNEAGALDENYDAESGKFVSFALAKPSVTRAGTVVNATEKFNEKRLKGKYQWAVPPHVIDMIIKEVFK